MRRVEVANLHVPLCVRGRTPLVAPGDKDEPDAVPLSVLIASATSDPVSEVLFSAIEELTTARDDYAASPCAALMPDLMDVVLRPVAHVLG